MTRKSKPNNKRPLVTKARQSHQQQSHSAVAAGPMLFKRSVVLTDAIELSQDNTFLGSGYGIISVSANGNFLPNGPTSIPQRRIWDQYAAMFQYYQVKSVVAKFMPYRLEYTAGQVTGLSTRGYPVQSIIDPDSQPPTGNLPSSFFSYGNCHVTKPYDVHHRAMQNFTDLGLSKQPTLILETNGSAAARALYTDPASLAFLARGASVETTGTGNSNQIGLLVYSIHYEFSGQRAPGLSEQPKPLLMGNIEEVKREAEQPQCEMTPLRSDGLLTPDEARRLYSGKD